MAHRRLSGSEMLSHIPGGSPLPLPCDMIEATLWQVWDRLVSMLDLDR